MDIAMQDRRAFLRVTTGSAIAAGVWNLNSAALGANEKVTLALVGGRNQGRGVAQRAIQAGAQFKTFCDLDPSIRDKTGAAIETAQGRTPQLEDRFERVLEDKDIDAVIIAVPDRFLPATRSRTCSSAMGGRSSSATRSNSGRTITSSKTCITFPISPASPRP